jgi:hypothetical protein
LSPQPPRVFFASSVEHDIQSLFEQLQPWAVCVIAALQAIDGCPTFAKAYAGFPVELSGVGALHAAFLNESRTRGCWWSLVQEIRIRRTKMMGAARRSLSLYQLADSYQASEIRPDSISQVFCFSHRFFGPKHQAEGKGKILGASALSA